LDPFKLIGGVLILLGVAFRAISIAYFKQRAKSLPDDPKIRLRHAKKQQRALLIDYAFIAAGLYTLVAH
jgi:hypothetical protein